MMFRNLFLVCAIMMLAACVPVPPTVAGGGENSPAPETPVIILIRSGGLAGKVLQWDIYPSGRGVSGKGTEAIVSAEQVTAAIADLEKLGFFELADPGGKTGRCADCYVIELRVRSGSKDRTLMFTPEASGASAELQQIMEKVNGLLQALPKE